MHTSRRLRSEQGAALVEFALSISVMLAVLLGLFVMLMAFYTYHYVSYAAREGSRYAIVRGADCSQSSTTMPGCNATSSEIQTYVRNLGFPGINPNEMTVTSTWLSANGTFPATWSPCTAAVGCNVPGNEVQVQVQYAFPLKLPFISSRTLNLGSTSTMVISQ